MDSCIGREFSWKFWIWDETRSLQAGYWDQSVQRATTGIQYSTCWICTDRILRSVRTTSNYRYTVQYMLDPYRQDTEISPYNEQLQVYSTVHVGSVQSGCWNPTVQRATTGIQYSTCWICTVRILKSDRTTSNYRYTVLQCIFCIDKLVQGNLGIKNRILFIFVKYRVTHKGWDFRDDFTK